MSELNDPRVLFAAERTLLAWSRTSLALIGFGFIVEKSSSLSLGVQEADSVLVDETTTVVIGIGFIVLGVIAAFFSSLQHVRFVKTLGSAEIPAGYFVKFGLMVNIFVGVLGGAICLALYLNDA